MYIIIILVNVFSLDGSLFMCTPVDPLFLILPYLVKSAKVCTVSFSVCVLVYACVCVCVCMYCVCACMCKCVCVCAFVLVLV